MRHKPSCMLMGMLAIVGCFGQASSTDQHVKQLIEHWRWKQYWEGTTELGALYSAGREFQTLLFWRAGAMPPSVGFCSADLGVCQFYPDTSGTEDSFEMKVPAGEDLRSAFQRFLADSFGQKASLLARLEAPKASDYATEMVKIILPPLDPPEAIRDRRTPPRSEIDALVASLSCLPDQPGCKVHLLIPYYSHSDPAVPVFRECSRCPNPKPMIIFMKLIDGHWWHGSQDYNASSDFVDRTRRQIERALLVEVNR